MKKLFLALTTIINVVSAFAQVENSGLGNIYFDILDPDNHTAVIVGASSNISGDWIIPDKASYEGVEYTIVKIGDAAFSNCRSLISVVIPTSVTSIGQQAFDGCTSLTSVQLPNKITEIAGYTFRDCVNMISVGIPNSVTSISYGVFYGCKSLTSVVIPTSVAYIGEQAFTGCSALSGFEVDPENQYYSAIDGILYNKDATTLVCFPGGHSQKDCFTVPDDVTSIGECAFMGCTSLTAIDIPNSVTSIGRYAFTGCMALQSMVIPGSVTSIGQPAFNGCASLSVFEVDRENWCYSAIDGILYNKDATTLVCFPGGHNQKDCFTVPDDVTSIGEFAFMGCTALTAIDIPGSVTSIGKYAFTDCEALTAIEIPGSVTSIDVGVFGGCKSLTSIKIPDSVTSIGTWAFDGCTSLTSIELPNLLTTIGQRAFQACEALTAIEIPGRVTSIGIAAFLYCDALTSVTIPGSVVSIGDGAFYGCYNISEVNYKTSNPIEGDQGIFSETVFASATLNIGMGGEEKARAIAPWMYFGNIVGVEFSGTDEIVAKHDKTSPTEVYNLEGICVASSIEGLSPGLYIIRQGDSFQKFLVK